MADATKTTQLKEKLQQHLNEAKRRVESAQQELAQIREEDKESIRQKTAEVRQRIEAQRIKAGELREQAERWMRDKQQHTSATLASWREKRELKHLQRRAERAEEYAVNAVVATMIDADLAEEAVLDALDARLDADVAASR